MSREARHEAMPRALPFCALLLASMLVMACTAHAPATVTGGAKVEIVNFTFTPQEVTIKPGESVTWSNVDGSPHAVAFKDGSAGIKLLLPGENFVRAFPQPGSYEYFCSIHNFMTGRIIVHSPEQK